MGLGASRNAISTKELEQWLSKVFVPVEPSEVFIRRLKARLLKYRGDQVFSVWMVIGVIAMVLMIMLTWMGFLLRIFLILTSLFLERRESSRKEKPMVMVGG
jgi:hypothetical protein